MTDSHQPAGQAQPCYQLRQVSKAYDRRTVLQVDRLNVQWGEIFALVGPSGAGKSTLLRLLNFLEPPSTGTIAFLDEEVGPGNSLSLEKRRRITTVFQRPLLLNRTVQANVSYGLRLRGNRNGMARVEQALDEVGLASLRRQAARSLSGGEAQRVALARALVLQPDVLLLDEPTANLDPYNVGLIEGIVRNFNQSSHGTVILVTHNVFQARRLAHRVAFLLDGQIVEVAPTQAFFDGPQDHRTAAFVRGDMVY